MNKKLMVLLFVAVLASAGMMGCAKKKCVCPSATQVVQPMAQPVSAPMAQPVASSAPRNYIK